MRLCLVGADFEENLGLGMIAAAAEAAGHAVTVVPFNHPRETARVAAQLLVARPDVIGLGIQFQHRAHEFLSLAASLRVGGFRGHITAGGQYPTLAWRESLDARHGLDSVVLHDGEETLVALLAALREGAPLDGVAGLALRGREGVPYRTAGRRLRDDLDALPFARRYRAHTKHMGIPFIPIMGSRGCWGACSYCAITSFYRDARAHGGGRTVRMRSPDNVAREMAVLWHGAGGDAIFCFHDDNFLLPRPEHTLERVRALRAALDGYGVGRAAIIGKCRPETVTPALARELRALGVIRLYVGVENASEHGALDLRRGTQWRAVNEALDACRDAGVFVCYNLLVFEPDSTLDDVRANIAFIRAHADHPVNFCRAEPYHGTPLHQDLAARARLSGSHLGWDYRIEDPRVELLFRVVAAAFRQRNFDPEGVANRYMGLGYSVKLLEFFHEDLSGRVASIARRAREITRGVALETAGYLEEAIALAAHADLAAHDAIERETARLGLRIAASDRAWHVLLDALYDEMTEHARRAARPRPARAMPRSLARIAQHMAFGASIALGASGCGSMVVDPVPQDAGMSDQQVVDPVPVDAGRDAVTPDHMVVDPLPVDAGMDVMGPVDPPPPDAGFDVLMPVDPPPPDAGRRDALNLPRRALPLIDQWRETTPKRSRRDAVVALYAPPDASLAVTRGEGHVRVSVDTGGEPASARWEGDGAITEEGVVARWAPAGPEDQLRVAVRTRGGVAVLALRACEVERRARPLAEIREEG